MTQGLCVLAVACLAVPLSGCYGVIVPKPIPEWAVYSMPDVVAPRRHVARAPRDAGISPAAVAARRTPLPTPAAEFTTYGAEWRAQQDAADEQLRKRMNICRGC